MLWMLKIFCGLGILLKLIECLPTTPIASSKLQGKKSQIELVYPQLYADSSAKTESLKPHLILVLRTFGETFYIELKRNTDILKPNASEELAADATRNCHYQGTVLSHPNGRSAISICGSKNKMTGTVMIDSHSFVLRPLDHLQDEEEVMSHLQNASSNQGIEPHVIHKVEDSLVHFCGLNHNDEISNHRRFRRSEERIQYKVIETSVFVDYPLYRKFTVEKKRSLQELKDAVLAIINQVQIIYNYSPLTIKFKIALVKLEFLTTKNAPNPANGNIDDYLDNFCYWQSLRNPPEHEEGHWDHSIMLSGYDLHKISDGKANKKVLGLAWVNGMCRPKNSCTLNEGSSFEAAFVIAHEMGHSLGMLHDGRGNDCDPAAYLMAEKTGPGRVTWSKCSNEYLLKFFAKGRGSCLEDDDNNLVEGRQYASKELPGHRFDLDAQCKLSLGNQYRPHIASKVPFNNVCRQLWCVSGLWASVAHPALEGSSCGNGGQCIQGKCEGRKMDKQVVHNHSKASLDKMLIEFMDKLKVAFQLILP